MRRNVVAFGVFLIVFLSNIGVCHAGDVPEALLYTDSALLYFGKVTELTDTTITILPLQKVKGEVELDKAVTYSQKIHGWKPQVGKTYLFGYIDENNLYFWVTDSMNPKTLKLKDPNGMDLRLQEYLNNGDFEKAEEARQKKAAATVTPFVSAAVMPLATLENRPSESATAALSLPTIAKETKDKYEPSLYPIIFSMLPLAIIICWLFLIKKKKSISSSKKER